MVKNCRTPATRRSNRTILADRRHLAKFPARSRRGTARSLRDRAAPPEPLRCRPLVGRRVGPVDTTTASSSRSPSLPRKPVEMLDVVIVDDRAELDLDGQHGAIGALHDEVDLVPPIVHPQVRDLGIVRAGRTHGHDSVTSDSNRAPSRVPSRGTTRAGIGSCQELADIDAEKGGGQRRVRQVVLRRLPEAAEVAVAGRPSGDRIEQATDAPGCRGRRWSSVFAGFSAVSGRGRPAARAL